MDKYINVLKNVSLFCGIEEQDIHSLLNCLSSKLVNYKTNQAIFQAGDVSKFVGIVLSGEIQVINDDFYGNRNIITTAAKGQLFGEAFACADVKVLPVSIYATCDSDILLIDYKKIITTCTNSCVFHNKLIYNMLRIVANKNILLSQKIEVISKRTTRQKIMSYLSNEAKKAEKNSFFIQFNRQQLADFLSVDRSAMSNELCKLRNEGILKFEKNSFTLL